MAWLADAPAGIETPSAQLAVWVLLSMGLIFYGIGLRVGPRWTASSKQQASLGLALLCTFLGWFALGARLTSTLPKVQSDVAEGAYRLRLHIVRSAPAPPRRPTTQRDQARDQKRQHAGMSLQGRAAHVERRWKSLATVVEAQPIASREVGARREQAQAGFQSLQRGDWVDLYGPEWTLGDTVQVVGTVRAPPSYHNEALKLPGALARLKRPTRARVFVPSISLVHLVGGNPLQTGIHRLRNAIRDRLQESARIHRLSTSAHAFVRAVTLGEASALPEALSEGARATGLRHLLAVSGLHMALVIGGLYLFWVQILRRLMALLMLRGPCRKVGFIHRVDANRVAAGLSVAFVPLLVPLMGGGPSAQRAGWMALLVGMARCNGRSLGGARSLVLAALVLIVLDPWLLNQVGFWLSVVATAAIVSSQAKPEASSPSQPSRLRAFIARPRMPQREDAMHVEWRALKNLRVAARVLAVTGPLVWWMFGGLPSASLLANTLMLPLAAGVLLPLSIAYGICFQWIPGLAWVAGQLVSWGIDGLQFACLLIGTWCPVFDAPAWSGWTWLFGILLCWSVVLLPRSLLRRSVSGLCLLALCTSLCLGWIRGGWPARLWRQLPGGLQQPTTAFARWVFHASKQDEGRRSPPNTTSWWGHSPWVRVLDVGQGDATLVSFPSGGTVLIDAGGAWNASDRPGRDVVLPALALHASAQVDLLVITHPHPDHYDGVLDLLDKVVIREVWTSGQALHEQPDGPYVALINELKRRGAIVRRPDTLCSHAWSVVAGQGTVPCRREGPALDDCVAQGQVEDSRLAHAVDPHALRVLSPCPEADVTLSENNNSIVLQWRMFGRRFLWSGDLEKEGERALLRDLRVAGRLTALRADVLKAGHHGSRTSSTQAFLRAVAPQDVVISAGRNNRFGHPHPEVLDALAETEARVWLTPVHGGVLFDAEGAHPSRPAEP